MRLTRPKPSQPLHLLLGRVNTRLDHVGHKIFSRLSREVKSPSLKHLRTQTRQQPQTAHCKMCNIWTKSFTDVRMESFFVCFFEYFLLLENCRAFEVHSLFLHRTHCVLLLCMSSQERLCVNCSVQGSRCLSAFPSHQFPLCYWSSLKNHRI